MTANARRLFALLALMVAVAACAPGSPGGARGRKEVLGLDVGGITELDVFAPTSVAGREPVVVLLHGTTGDRSRLWPLARELVDRGAVVMVPDWPVIVDQPDRGTAAPLYAAQLDAVTCSLRMARRIAPRFGGDPDRLTVVGYSGGGMVGASVALVRSPPWGGDCGESGDHAPTAFVGLAGDYAGAYQYASSDRSSFERYAPGSLDPTNDDLVVLLIHGANDRNVNAAASFELADRLGELGIDVSVLTTDGGHADLIDPSTSEGGFVADALSRFVRNGDSRPPDPDTANLTFDGERCQYQGPLAPTRGSTVSFAMENRSGQDAAIALVSVQPGSNAPDLSLGREMGPLFMVVGDGPHVPLERWVDGVVVRHVPGGSTSEVLWTVTDADRRWIAVCLDQDLGTARLAMTLDGTLATLETPPDG